MKDPEGSGHSPPVATQRLDAGVLFRAHGPFVARFLTRMGVAAAELEDVLQEVFMVAHRLGGWAPGPAKPTTWLAEIALRVSSDHRRAARRRSRSIPASDRIESAAAVGTGPAGSAEARQELARVDRALGTLDDAHRVVFVLFEIEGQACSEIAAALGVPVGTVHSRLHYARNRFLLAWTTSEVAAGAEATR